MFFNRSSSCVVAGVSPKILFVCTKTICLVRGYRGCVVRLSMVLYVLFVYMWFRIRLLCCVAS